MLDLIDNTKKLSNEDTDKVLESLLNKYLKLLKPLYTKEKIRKISKKVDDLTDFFMDVKNDDDVIVSDGDFIADDLIAKVMNNNDRKIKLPIKIDYIKEYCITSLVKEKDINKELVWIILRIATIYYCLK